MEGFEPSWLEDPVRSHLQIRDPGLYGCYSETRVAQLDEIISLSPTNL